MELISAKEARDRINVARNKQHEIAQNLLKTKYLSQIHSAIKKACDKGLDSTFITIKIPNLYQTEIKKCLANYFQENGYHFYAFSGQKYCFNRIAIYYQIDW